MAHALLSMFLTGERFPSWMISIGIWLAMLLAVHIRARSARQRRILEVRLRLEAAWENTIATGGLQQKRFYKPRVPAIYKGPVL